MGDEKADKREVRRLYRPPRSGSQVKKEQESAIDGQKTALSAMEKRRLRFQPSNAPVAGYGLVSRGEDLTLKEDPNARVALFASIKADMEKFTNDPSLQDKILMAFRKLREGIIAGKESNLELKREAIVASFRFSIGVGHYQSYLPTLGLLQDDLKMQLSQTERDEVAICKSLHLSHIESKHEEAFAELLFHFASWTPSSPLTDNDAPIQSTIYGLIVANMRNNSVLWIQHYKMLPETSLYARLLAAIALPRHQTRALYMVTKSYKMLPLETFRGWTNSEPDTSTVANCNIIVIESTVKFQRTL